MYNYNYNSTGLESVLVGLGAVVIFLALIVIAVAVVYLIALWKIFKKAGKNGWEAIVPFYNQWILVEIAGLNWWWFLIMISGTIVSLLSIPGLSAVCSLANLVAMFFVNYNLAKKFHKEVGTAILMTIFSAIMYPVVGFSKDYQFDNSVVVSPNGPIGENNVQQPQNNQPSQNSTTDTNSASSKFCTNCGTKVVGNEKFCTNCGNKLD